MADYGEYATLRFGQEPNHHGPLLFWLTALAIKIFGPTPFAATLSSRLFGFGCIVLTAWLGCDLFGEKTGWLAALALATNYTFFRNTTTLRMDSALTFGILIALVGYLRWERRWGPPVFYGGVAVAVLAKSIAGFLPLLICGLHAIFARRFCYPWRKQSLRWLYWSPLLLVPLAWWGFLAIHYGTAVFANMLSDFEQTTHTGIARLDEFLQVYFVEFGRSYILWLPFALIGGWMAVRAALNTKTEAGKRAALGLLLGWIGIVYLTNALKPEPYERYLMPALPAISLISALAAMRILRDKLPVWIPGTVAVVTVAAAIGMTCLPVSDEFNDEQRMSAMEEILNQRLVPHSPVPVLTLGATKQWPANEGRSRFFLGRDARPTTMAEALKASARGRFTVIVLKRDYASVAARLKLDPLVETSFWVLAEAGLGNDIKLISTPN
jgi:4-amino-4-deoxy-L-arabinose transferase-like glycosyltransferase